MEPFLPILARNLENLKTMLALILLLTMMPLAVLVVGFFDIKLPFVSEHPEMHLLTLIKEHINALLHLHHYHGEGEIGRTVTA